MRDPITEWSNAIKTRLAGLGVVIIMTCFVLLLVAPAFGPLIKRWLRKEYVIYSNYEERAEKDMKKIRPFLWIIAIASWILMGLIVL